jgi:hypothetical protein
MTKKELSILSSALMEIQSMEHECFRQMAYMKEHKFDMERLTINYKQEAYNQSWLVLSMALDKLK